MGYRTPDPFRAGRLYYSAKIVWRRLPPLEIIIPGVFMNECEAWERAILRWEVARGTSYCSYREEVNIYFIGLPYSFDRMRGDATIVYNLSYIAVKRQIGSLQCSKCIHQFLDRSKQCIYDVTDLVSIVLVLSCCETKDLQKDSTVLCRLQYMIMQQFNLAALGGILLAKCAC